MDTETFERGKNLKLKMNNLKSDLNRISQYGLYIMSCNGKLSLSEPSEAVLNTCKLLVEADLKSQLEAAEKEFAEL
jgi:hypothetical protein